jgi:uncharacterized protein (TIGR03067 family)
MEANTMISALRSPFDRRLMVAIAAVATVLGIGMAMGQDRPQTDLDNLQGAWVERGDGLTKMFLVSGNHFADIFQFKDGITTTQATIELDETKEPKEITFSFSDATGRGVALRGTISHSIYKLDGNTFTLSAPTKAGRTATSFEPSGGPQHDFVVTFARLPL